MVNIRDARNGGSLSTAALSKFEHLWTSRDEIAYEKFDLGFDLLRGSYVDRDLLRGFNFEPFAGKIDDSTWVENLGPKSGTAPTVHLVTTH
jgi:hypothetical protein